MIRKAVPEDIPAIAEAYAELLVFEEKNGSTSNWKLGVYPTDKYAQDRVKAGMMYVLEEEGKICASMVLNQEQADDYNEITWKYPAEDEEVFVIHTLCIPPQMSGRGFGTQMLKFAMDFAKDMGCTVIRLDTYAYNEPAKRLYQKHGFQISGYADVFLQGLIPEKQVYLECDLTAVKE